MKKIITCLFATLMLCSCKASNEETKGVVLSYIVSFEEFKEEYEKR